MVEEGVVVVSVLGIRGWCCGVGGGKDRGYGIICF